MSNIPLKPTHRLAVRVKLADGTMGKEKGYVGKAWQNADNSFTIKLNPGCSLEWRDGLAIGLFPIDDTRGVPDGATE